MLQGYTMAIVPCGNPTPKKLRTGGGEWPTFRTARAQRLHSACTAHSTPPRRRTRRRTGSGWLHCNAVQRDQLVVPIGDL